MSEAPKFIREFSKEKFSKDRTEKAKQIRNKRSDCFLNKKLDQEEISKLDKETEKGEKTLSEQLKNIEETKDKIEQLSVSGLGKVLNYFKLKKLKADAILGENSYEELKNQQDIKIDEKKLLALKIENKKTYPGFEDAKIMLDNFYKEQEREWANSEYTEEDMCKYFSEEYLSSLSLQDYILLLRRFPGEMVTHITRQGVRDHVGHMYHTSGKGDYSDGFTQIIEDGRLRSRLGTCLVNDAKDKEIIKFLKLDEIKTEQDALKTLNAFTNPEKQYQPGAGSYADAMAIHFATEEVADAYYGSEKGNEIFIAYPSALIATQYYFKGQLIVKENGYHNDQWVWANEERGLDLNAGVVFIREDAKVNRSSGSRYELDDNKNPIINQKNIDIVKKVFSSPKIKEIIKTIRFYGNYDEENRENLETFRKQLKDYFKIDDDQLQKAILNSIYDLSDYNEEGEKEGHQNTIIEQALRSHGIFYAEAKDAITSKEFWENYFTKRPKKKPSKIVYYKGGDPTEALYRWREDNGIINNVKDRDFFEAKKIPEKSSKGTVGINRFRTLAEKVIKEYYS